MRFRARLLGRHISGRASQGWRIGRTLFVEHRQAEVEHPRSVTIPVEHNVRGFQIPVNDLFPVNGLENFRDGRDESRKPVEIGVVRLLLPPAVNRPAIDELLNDYDWRPLSGKLVERFLEHIVHVYDAWPLDIDESTSFMQELLADFLRRILQSRDFQRHETL